MDNGWQLGSIYFQEFDTSTIAIPTTFNQQSQNPAPLLTTSGTNAALMYPQDDAYPDGRTITLILNGVITTGPHIGGGSTQWEVYASLGGPTGNGSIQDNIGGGNAFNANSNITIPFYSESSFTVTTESNSPLPLSQYGFYLNIVMRGATDGYTYVPTDGSLTISKFALLIR